MKYPEPGILRSLMLVFGFGAVGTVAYCQVTEPDLSQLSKDTQAMIQSACALDRRVNGPAAYYRCLNSELQKLNQGPAEPDLTHVSRDAQAMIQSACSLDRRVNGPAAYYRCLNSQLQKLNQELAEPDLSQVSRDAQVMIQSACALDRRVNGPAAYYRCLNSQIQKLNQGPAAPDLSQVARDAQAMILSACALDRRVNGPAAYYGCLSRQLAAIKPISPSPSKQLTDATPESDQAISTPSPTVTGDSLLKTAATSATAKTYSDSGDSPQIEGLAAKQSPPVTNDKKPNNTPGAAEPQASPAPNRTTAPAAPEEDSTAKWVSLLFLALVGVGARAWSNRRPKSCSKCGDALSVNGVCERCQKLAADNATRSAAEAEAKRRAAEGERREQQRRADAAREEERRRIRTLEDLQKLSGQAFEELIGSLFARDGYQVHHCGGSGDDGIDLVLQIGHSKDVVQCKRWRADIGSPVVRDFYGALMHAGARHGFIVTTASFSQSARAFASGKPITLLGSKEIVDWLNKNNSSADQGAYASSHRGESNAFDPYQVLGVSRSAAPNEIRAAYRERMTKYHPDKVAHLGIELQELARKKALELNRAYELLTQAAP